jgi:regulator of sirC expression with transglutaminase-like and TPR domain
LVVTTEERREIDKKLAAISGEAYEARVARAQALTEARLWYDAIDAYNALIERFPDRAELYEARGTIYAQLACTRSLAGEDLERAEKAGDEKK